MQKPFSLVNFTVTTNVYQETFLITDKRTHYEEFGKAARDVVEKIK